LFLNLIGGVLYLSENVFVTVQNRPTVIINEDARKLCNSVELSRILSFVQHQSVGTWCIGSGNRRWLEKLNDTQWLWRQQPNRR